MGHNFSGLGMAYHTNGQQEKAIKYFNKALKIHKETGYRQGEAYDLADFGEIYQNIGDVKKAIDYYKQALIIFEEIKSSDADWVRRKLDELTKLTNPFYNFLYKIKRKLRRFILTLQRRLWF
jgi:tetratricopeptide (TPR) repeat protein